MQFRTYVWFMGMLSVVAWLSWGVVVMRIDPYESGWIGLGLFYLTLFVSLVGSLATGGVLLRRAYRHRHELLFREVRIAFRHALILSAVAVTSLALAARHALAWWHIGALLVLVSLVEYLFLILQESHRS